MKKNVLLVLINLRKKDAVNVQKILTEWGCVIKTRLGLHTGALEECSDNGLVFIELAGEEAKHKELQERLNVLPGVDAKLVQLEI